MNNRKKRIAFISEHASPLADIGTVDTGGQNVYVAQLAKHLAAQAYLVDVYTRRDDPLIDELIQMEAGIRVIHIKAGPEKNIIKEELLPYMQEFENNMIAFILQRHLHYELIHANFFMSAMVACGIKKELEIPFVVTFHALGHVRRKYQAGDDRFPTERIAIEEAIILQADHIIAECPQDMDDLVNYYHAPPGKISVVPCGFSPAEFYPIEKAVARRILKLPVDGYLLLQLGRMVPRKGIDNVIHALAYLKKISDTPFKLVIVGGDCEEMERSNCAEYKRLCDLAKKLKVSDRIEFAGRKNRSELKFYYCAADLFITTPWYEPFGITPLEAMACGTPVVGAEVGGIKYSVADGSTGALVPPKRPGRLAAKIIEIISTEGLLHTMSKNAIKHVNTHFTWAEVAKQINSLYQYVISVAKENHVKEEFIRLKHDNQAA
ncbi:MAG: glycosyl transferase group 1 [Mucilaginibacter sp.]|nr:glycosyl transferase group 1 [Mucilaginibacter sp.]